MNQTQKISRGTDRVKSLFNWGELSRLLSGTRSVVLKDKYPKKHEPFINDLCNAVKPVLVKYGYAESEDYLVIPNDAIITPDCSCSQHAE